MPDPSNPTARVMDVLNFLAAHPTESFTLAEIARHVGLSNGSAHRLLTTMAARQFLSRNERHRTYSLGIALVALGQAAIEKQRGIEFARREVARLATSLDAQCSANALVDGEILVLVREGIAGSNLGLTRVGERRPLVPPVGMCLVAWSGEEAIRDYVERARPYLDGPMLRHLQESFPLIRRRGFAIAANGPTSGRSRDAMSAPTDRVRDAGYWHEVFAYVGQLSPDEIQLFDLARADRAGVVYLAAPVFSADERVAFQLVLSGMPVALGASEIEARAERLCAAAAAVTEGIHGRPPDVH